MNCYLKQNRNKHRALSLYATVIVSLLPPVFILGCKQSGSKIEREVTTARYNIVNLGEVEAYALNNKGHVVGTNFNNGKARAFLWDGGKIHFLVSADTEESIANDINDKGKIAGVVRDASGRRRAVIWLSSGRRDLKKIGKAAMAWSINNREQVVGLSYSNDGSTHATLWDKKEVYLLNKLPPSSEALAINDESRVIGKSGIISYKSFVWQSGKMLRIPTSPDYAGYQFYDINNRGEIVGAAVRLGHKADATSNKTFALLLSEGQIKIIPTREGGATAFGINDRGQIVGEAYYSPREGHVITRAFMYDEARTKDLNSMISPGSGWTLQSALRINNRGQIIGMGILRGKKHSFLLTPL